MRYGIRRVSHPDVRMVIMVDRVGGAAGFGGMALVFVFVAMSEPLADPEDPSSVIAQALVDNKDSARLGAYVALIAAFLLIVFVSRLHGALRDLAGSSSWHPTVALVSGITLVGVVLIESGFTFAASELESYGQDPQVAKLFLLWSWNSASLYAPAFAGLLGGCTLVAFSANAFPTWFRWTSAALLVLLVLLAAVFARTRPRHCARLALDRAHVDPLGHQPRSEAPARGWDARLRSNARSITRRVSEAGHAYQPRSGGA